MATLQRDTDTYATGGATEKLARWTGIQAQIICEEFELKEGAIACKVREPNIKIHSDRPKRVLKNTNNLFIPFAPHTSHLHAAAIVTQSSIHTWELIVSRCHA